MITSASPSPNLMLVLGADDAAASPTRPKSSFDAAAAAAADKKLAGMREAVAKLKTLGNTAKSTGSEIARQKLEALKQRLKMLMMMGGDPKAVAREAAQIAKEIGQAAKDYAASAGGAPAAGADATPPPETAADANAPVAKPTAEGATPEKPDENPLATTTAGAKAADPPLLGAPKADGASRDKATVKTGAPAPAGPSGPDPVITEAKLLAAQAKAILKAALERAKHQHADPAELKEDQDKMNAADKDVADAAKAVAAADAPTAYSASGQGVDTPSSAEPAVSVRA